MNYVIVLLLTAAIAVAGVLGTTLALSRDGYRQVPTQLRF